MLNQIEFKERIQLLLAEATIRSKKQQCLLEYNKLCIKHKSETYLKLILNTLEMIKKPFLEEIEIKFTKITIQNFKDLINPEIISRLCKIIVKSYPEGSELIYNISSECFYILTNAQTLNQITDFLMQLALKLNSQLIQIGATISLFSVLSAVDQIPSSIKQQITSAFIRNNIIVHQSMCDIMLKLIEKDDQNLIQIIQRSLASLQDSKHTYQIKQGLCKVLEQIAKFENHLEENLVLQCITILREITYERIISLSSSAKSALQTYQNIYIMKNPPVVQSNLFTDIRPYVKKKRGDQHLVVDASKQKKLVMNQIKNQIDEIAQLQIQEQLEEQILEEQIEQDQQNEENQGIVEKIKTESDTHEEELEKTQLFDDLDKTMLFIDKEEKPYKQQQKVQESFDDHFNKLIEMDDDFTLLREMMTTENYLQKLTKKTAEKLISKCYKIYNSNFVELLMIQLLHQVQQTQIKDDLKLEQLKELNELEEQLITKKQQG